MAKAQQQPVACSSGPERCSLLGTSLVIVHRYFTVQAATRFQHMDPVASLLQHTVSLVPASDVLQEPADFHSNSSSRVMHCTAQPAHQGSNKNSTHLCNRAALP